MNEILRTSILGGVLVAAAVGCSNGASVDAAASSQAFAGGGSALIARASATSPRGRLVASPALGFGDTGAPAAETALCFAGAVDAVCARVAGDGIRVEQCEVDGDAVDVRYRVDNGPVVSRTVARCADTAGSADIAPSGTFVVASSARRDEHGNVVAGVSLGFSVDPNAPGPVAFCYSGDSADVCGLVQTQDCSVDGDTVTASYATGVAILTPCTR